ncbi:SGNH/GDSL hydrolase family protein [Brevundimonas sp. Marseille-Q4549]
MKKHALILALALAALTQTALAPCAQAETYWARSWNASPVAAAPDRRPPTLKDVTVRQVVRVSAGGDRFRLRLSNEYGPVVARIERVRIVQLADDGKPVPGTARDLTFDGSAGAVLAPEAPLLSDPVDLALPALARLSISLYLPDEVADPTIHLLGLSSGWIAPGDQTAAAELTDPVLVTQRILISGIDVQRAEPGRVIVTLGDSITDGANGTRDADRRWPDLLAARLQAAGLTSVAVANAGISGNRILKPKPGLGVAALARFDRDVLAVPGATDVIVLEGVNDFGMAWRDHDPQPPTPADLIAGYRQIIARAHAGGLKVRLATILPYKDANYWSEQGEATRQALNAWIRTSGEADGVIDFDAVMRDPAEPLKLAAAYDSGDHLHPNDAGFRAMADAIDLTPYR